MTKIEEIIERNRNKTDHYADQDFSDFGDISVESAMKEYAEVYAKKCLEIAAKEASANFECIGAVLGAENVNPYVEVESILKIKLPEHE